MQFILKIAISAIIIALVSEISKRSTLIASILISIPLTSILAFIWIYAEQKDVGKVIEMSYSIFWLVIPSLALFLILPLLLKQGIGFYLSLLISIISTSALYGLTTYLITKSGKI
jgi:uncharacterized membrane protein (GlpM family)